MSAELLDMISLFLVVQFGFCILVGIIGFIQNRNDENEK